MQSGKNRNSPLGALMLGLLAGLLLLPAWALGDGMVDKPARPDKMPRFLHKTPEVWINSKPLQPEDLQGEVVLVEVWTSV